MQPGTPFIAPEYTTVSKLQSALAEVAHTSDALDAASDNTTDQILVELRKCHRALDAALVACQDAYRARMAADAE